MSQISDAILIRNILQINRYVHKSENNLTSKAPLHAFLRDDSDDDESVPASISELTADQVLSSVARSINKIGHPSGLDKVSEVPPKAMAARYAMANKLAEACRRMGYKSEIGYQASFISLYFII